MPNYITPMLSLICDGERYKTNAFLRLLCRAIWTQCFSLVAVLNDIKPMLFFGCDAKRYKTNAFLRFLCRAVWNQCFSLTAVHNAMKTVVFVLRLLYKRYLNICFDIAMPNALKPLFSFGCYAKHYRYDVPAFSRTQR